MASPGMLQSGLSRALFETWCPDSRNSVIIAGYCVEGTLAKLIMSEPEEVGYNVHSGEGNRIVYCGFTDHVPTYLKQGPKQHS